MKIITQAMLLKRLHKKIVAIAKEINHSHHIAMRQCLAYATRLTRFEHDFITVAFRK